MQIILDNKKIEVENGKTILDICKEKGIEIPTLCVMEGLKPEARCRLCLVEVDGKLETSCSTYPKEGSKIITSSKRINKHRMINAELLMADHINAYKKDKNSSDLYKLIEKVGLKRIRFDPIHQYKEDLSESVIRNDNKCINCGKCIRACGEIMGVHAIDFIKRGHWEKVSPYFEHDLHDVACIKCGQCVHACPVGAIYEREHLYEVTKALKNPKKHVVVQTAPSVRVALGEEFGIDKGTIVTGKMVAALKKLGFDKVFDTDLGADITIMEEGTEFLKRVSAGGPFPMITTCCPAWIKYMEHFRHDLFPNMSTCKSPHEMLGNLTKSYYAKDKKNTIVVSIMPCTAKKFESTRPELKSDVDYVLTTRELAKLIRSKKINFKDLKNKDFDHPLGISTGAGVIFGATGGVMEAALRTAYELGTGKTLKKIDFTEIRGTDGIKEGSVKIGSKKIKFAVAHGGANIKKLLENKDKYHFIEMMACPGGCIGGGGQPWPTNKETIKKRMEAIYKADRDLPLRKSHENPAVQKLYKDFLGEPGSEKAHKLLHTYYHERDCF